MLKLKRYNIEPEWRVDKEWIKIEDPSGEFVLYDDYIQTEKEIDKLKEDCRTEMILGNIVRNDLKTAGKIIHEQEDKIKVLESKINVMRDHVKLLEESLLKKQIGENLEVK